MFQCWIAADTNTTNITYLLTAFSDPQRVYTSETSIRCISTLSGQIANRRECLKCIWSRVLMYPWWY